jgi:hypothetical protein
MAMQGFTIGVLARLRVRLSTHDASAITIKYLQKTSLAPN